MCRGTLTERGRQIARETERERESRFDSQLVFPSNSTSNRVGRPLHAVDLAFFFFFSFVR